MCRSGVADVRACACVSGCLQRMHGEHACSVRARLAYRMHTDPDTAPLYAHEMSECDRMQGRANASYFVPDSRYAVGSGPEAAQQEFQHLVKGLHARNLEVIIQVRPFFLFQVTTDTDTLALRAKLMRLVKCCCQPIHPAIHTAMNVSQAQMRLLQ